MCYNCSEECHDISTSKSIKRMTFLTYALSTISKVKVRGLALGPGRLPVNNEM